MKIVNILDKGNKNLEIHQDNRGIIADVFYDANIKHVAIIKSKPNAMRGNHYHKETTQTMLITKGCLEYWYKQAGTDEPAKMYLCKVGDLITTEPYEVHAIRIINEENEFIVFSEGKRGGMDYESDTYRVDSIIEK